MPLINVASPSPWLLNALQRCFATIAALLTQFFISEAADDDTDPESFSEAFPVAPAIRLLDREAIVTETIQPDRAGRVRYRGSWWSARCDRNVTLLPNTIVYVVGRYHLTLLVEPKV